MTKLEKRLDKIETKQLKEMALELMDDYREGAEIVFDNIIDELQKRLNEKDFIEFMDKM